MNTQESLDQLADRYRQQGYQVVLNPGPDDLPAFAKDFKVEILAKRPDGSVLVSAKASISDFERDPNLAKYAEIIAKQGDWRYDVTVLGPPPPATPRPNVDDASELQILKALDDAERLFGNGFAPQAVLTAWSAFESAMRHRLRVLGDDGGYGASPRSMLNELISAGEFSRRDFYDLEELLSLRNIIVHGFSVPEIGQGEVSFLADTTRRLLAESKPVEQAS